MNSQLNVSTRKRYSLCATTLRKLFAGSLTFIVTATLTFNTAYATISATYKAVPPTSAAAGSTTPPLVMLVMSNDHQLFSKAYTDYNDIIDATVSPAIAGADGVLETTYTDSFDYYGYFNSNRCYTFGSGKFSPTSNTGGGTFNHDCANNEWSGNFLNWASMTKMDVIRKVLYGGYRSTDNANTVLERAYIPKDAHAFVKTFSAPNATMRKYTPFNKASISLCNVSHASSGSSHGTLGHATPPSLRVADGTWERWASSEVAQCEWSDDTGADNSLSNLPTSGTSNDELGTFNVRVDVCVAGKEENNCTSYTDAGGSVTKKPTGLLQDYGSDDSIKFGLISGSYIENNSGGVLRKNISSMQNEINPNDGTFLNVQGIINTISTFRITSYNTGTKKYDDCNTHSIPVNTFLTSTLAGEQCQNWGNPLGEMYLEAVRYFAGQTAPSSDFAADDSTLVNTTNGFDIGLAPVTWDDPLSASNYCADCSIIVISSGLNSFDMDELSSASDIPGLSGAADVKVKTNVLNTTETITGNYFIGENGTDTNGACTSKDLTSILGDAAGICPEEPFAKGGYGIAGLAHHALLTDLRTGGSFPDKQNITTFGIALSRGLPTFTIPTSGTSITIMPICQANTTSSATASSSGWNQCSLIDLQVMNPVYISNKLVSGTLRIHYEDSHWGNDYDMDGVEDLSFCVGASCPTPVNTDQVTINVTSPTAAAGNALRFGYTIGGTTADGEKFPLLRTGGDNYNSISPGSATPRNCSQAPVSNISACTTTYTAGSSSIKTLESPLWYAAKWGGYIDTDADGLPNLTTEWDSINNITEAAVPDGIPDNYLQSDNPAVLESQLNKIFGKLLNRTSAGSAAAVITDSISTVGSIYQALYQPKREKQGLEVSWVGQIQSIFIDAYGHLREDTNEDKILDSADEYILVKYSDDFERTQIWYCSPSAAEKVSSVPFSETVCPRTDRKEISELKPVWNANHELAKFSATDSRLTSQRSYTTAFTDTSNGGRHILTWQDLDGDNDIDSGEVVPFVASSFTDVDGSGNPTKAGLLGVANSGNAANDLTEITNIVDFIRGYEDPATTGYRSRTIDFRPATGDEVWRMGDIIHSSPVAIGPPNGTAYGSETIEWSTFGDSTYTTFKDLYKDRRTVLYVGANDGLVHAYNAGFYNIADQEYCLDLACTNDSSTSHTLGAELWAYAPRNLLPQLKFLTEPNYPHVYYVDGEPRTFDVNIFPNDTDHPGGWGTILVVGMQFGGGAHNPITVDIDNTGTTTFTTGSAYVIFDITNPEVAPKVLGEFTHPELGFTTSTPTLLVKRSPDSNNNWAAAGTSSYPNDFRLVFGSGPNKLSTGLSDQNAKLFMVKLQMNGDVLDLSSSNQVILDTAIENSFIGAPNAKNWNNDFLFDAIYFGVAGGTEASPNGRLMRVALNTNDPTNWAMSTMLDSAQPFLNMPVAKTIENPNTEVDENWVFAGTGRLYTSNDNASNTQQSFYGFREDSDTTYPNSPATKLFSTNSADANYLQNVTGVQVFRYGDIDANALAGELPMVTFPALELHIDTKAGWFKNFSIPSSSERDLARATLFGGLVIFPTYIPNTNICRAEGNSLINAVYQRTGTGYPGEVFTDETSYFGSDTTNWESLPSINYGIGLVSEITIKKNVDNSITLVCTTSTGEICNTLPPDPIPCTGSNCAADTGRQSWREILLF